MLEGELVKRISLDLLLQILSDAAVTRSFRPSHNVLGHAIEYLTESLVVFRN